MYMEQVPMDIGIQLDSVEVTRWAHNVFHKDKHRNPEINGSKPFPAKFDGVSQQI